MAFLLNFFKTRQDLVRIEELCILLEHKVLFLCLICWLIHVVRVLVLSDKLRIPFHLLLVRGPLLIVISLGNVGLLMIPLMLALAAV
jgi:hypothetical protein